MTEALARSKARIDHPDELDRMVGRSSPRSTLWRSTCSAAARAATPIGTAITTC